MAPGFTQRWFAPLFYVIIRRMDEKLSLQGKVAVVTGATAGIGLAVAIAMADQGATVIGVGRNSQRCCEAETAIRQTCPGAQVHFLLAELSQQSQVRHLAQEVCLVLDKMGKDALDVLVNNAGLFSGRLVRTEDGIERTLAVNHIAAFLLTYELMPQLKVAPAARVLTVSSASHYNARLNLKRINHPLIYFSLSAYEISKLCNVLFTYEFNRRYTSTTTMRAFAIDPGLVNTSIGQKGQGWFESLIWDIRRRGGHPPEVPARTILYLAAQLSVQDAKVYYWKDCQPKAPSRQALRTDLARDLWTLSCQMCTIKE
jgi:NAD(P)-dependent dehydrogenase (short-subunit alcohol dehydrogenase family)